MSAKFKPVTMYRNSGWSLILKAYQDIKMTTVFPLAGYTAKSQLRAGENRASALLAEIDVAVDTTANTLTLSISQADLSDITASKGYFDILLLPTAPADPFYLDLGGPCEAYIEDGITSTEVAP